MARFAKLLVALALVPFLFASARFLWLCLERVSDWPGRELMLLGSGGGVAVLAYWFLPRPTWFYVLGHETTHALAVWLSGGKVMGFRVSGQGGQVVADRNSPLIALAPYVFPFYPAVVFVLWLLLRWVWPGVEGWVEGFWVVWGAAWGYHLAFTASVLKTAQPDFASQGYLFSFVTIALGNLWLAVGLLWLWLRPLSLEEAAAMVWRLTGQSYAAVGSVAWSGFEWLRAAARRL